MVRGLSFAGAIGAALLSSAAMAVTPLTTTVTTTAAQLTTTISQTRGTIGSTTPVGAGTTPFNGTTTQTGTTAATISTFNTNTGILVGATYSVNIPYSLQITALATAPANGSGRQTDVSSILSGSVSLGGTNLQVATLGSTGSPATASCGAGNCTNASSNNTASTNFNNGNQRTFTGTATVANLANVATAGTGTISFGTQVTATNTSVQTQNNVYNGTAFTQLILGSATAAQNQYSATYSYYKFSNASLSTTSDVDALPLNFGSVFVGDSAAAQTVRLTNIGDINTADLKLNSVTPSGSSAFTTTLVPLSGLVAGTSSSPASVNYTASAVGTQTNTFTLNVIDDVAGGVGMKTQLLTITATGTGVGRANASFAATSGTTSASFDMGSRWILGGTQTTLNNVFSIYNTAAFGSAGLELVSITQDNTAAGFSLVPSSFGPIAAGSSQGFKLSINPASLGAQSSIFSIILRDYAPGVQGTPRQYTLQFTANAFVDEVPELSSWAMMIIGFGMVGAAARRRARSATAA